MSKGKKDRCQGKLLAVYYQISEERFRSYDGHCPSDDLTNARKRQANCSRAKDLDAQSIVIIMPKSEKQIFPKELSLDQMQKSFEIIDSQ